MTANELCESLNITRRIMAAWVKRGMPHGRDGKRYLFDHEKVRAWLLKEGLAREDDVVSTIAEVASHFDVASRTVSYWRERGMPGEPGYFHLGQIAKWRGEQQHIDPDSEETTAARARLLTADAELKELKELKLAQARGELVELEPIRRALVRHIHEAKAIISQIPDRLLHLLPPKTPAKLRRKLRDESVQAIDAAYQSLADMLRGSELSGSVRLTRAERIELIEAAVADLDAVVRARLLRELAKKATTKA